MRLKTYTAPTTAEALEMVRQEMGDDAIIVSTQSAADGDGVRVSAALEDTALDGIHFGDDSGIDDHDIAATVRQALTYNGTPPRLAERLAQAAETADGDDPTLACAAALDALFTFRPLPETSGTPIMLIGPPGAGKTITTAKLAARSTLSGHIAGVITTDTQRAGGVEQLAAFTRILDINLQTAATPDELHQAVAACRDNDAVFIDTAGTNPFNDTEMDCLAALIQAAGAEPVLVLAAGGDAMESADTAAAFATVGPRRLLVTRLDLVRRLGGVVAAADAAQLTFCDVSVTPNVGDGISPINPVSLARFIMPQTVRFKGSPHMTEATS